MWESREQKESYYRQMYGGWGADSVIQLTNAQIKHIEEFKKSMETMNPCLEIPLGIGKTYSIPLEQPVENYKLLLL